MTIAFVLSSSIAASVELWRFRDPAKSVGITDARLEYSPVVGGFEVECSRDMAVALAAVLRESGDDSGVDMA